MSDVEERAQEWVKAPVDKKDIPTPVLPYESKLVAYIDILGVKDKVENSGDDAAQIVDIMNQIRTYVDSECSELKKEDLLNSLQIGDGFFIMVDFKYVNEICEILAAVQCQILINSHMLLRGALTAGKVAIGDDEEYFIGPAIIDAITLENQNAIFPRIVFNSMEIEKYVKKRDIKYKYIAEDQDKIKYLDYIKYYIESDKFKIENPEDFLKKNGVDKFLREAYVKHLNSKKREAKREAQKYGWLIYKFDINGIKMV
ncbi:MAG: hypothetical protein WC455_05650 [Dehalococcoidia bacterium]